MNRQRFLVIAGLVLIAAGFYFGAQETITSSGSYCGTAFDSEGVLSFEDFRFNPGACDGALTGQRVICWGLMLVGAVLIGYRVYSSLPSGQRKSAA